MTTGSDDSSRAPRASRRAPRAPRRTTRDRARGGRSALAGGIGRPAAIGLIAGLATITVVVGWRDVGAIAAALAAVGGGFLVLPLAFLPSLVLASEGWRILFARDRRPRFLTALRAMWVGRSAVTFLPLTSIGADAIRARVIAQSGAAGADAAASIVLAQTAQALALALWALVGAAGVLAIGGDDAIAFGAAALALLLAVGVAGYVVVQHRGVFGLGVRLLGRIAPWIGDHKRAGWRQGGDDADRAVRALYRDPGRLLWSVLLDLASNLALTVEVWLIALWIGAPIGVVEALALKALTGAVRGAVFVVPGGLGIQEASFVLLAAQAGLTPELALAISLAGRGRELLVALPGMIHWQRLEGRALARRRGTTSRTSPATAPGER